MQALFILNASMNNEKSERNVAKAKGGIARAASLSSEQKKQIAKKAAAARWDQWIPKPQYVGELNIAGSQIPCAVFDKDGKLHRVIVLREVVGLLTGNKKGGLDRYLAASNLQPFVPDKFKNKALDQVTIAVDMGGKRAQCFEGEDIVDICGMYLEARKQERYGNKILLSSQEHLADQAEIIISSLAKVGIAGLIDEATGFQYVRERDALEKYLETIIRKELAAWIQRFPNEFFKQIYRLRGWVWTGTGRHPSVTGKYITDLVYSRLGPGVLEDLERLNPKTEKGARKVKHHQWLTEDTGHPMLSQHLHALISMMRGFDDWDSFHQFADRAFPKQDVKQLPLFL